MRSVITLEVFSGVTQVGNDRCHVSHDGCEQEQSDNQFHTEKDVIFFRCRFGFVILRQGQCGDRPVSE